MSTEEARKWENLNIEKKIDWAKRVQSWVVEQEPIEGFSMPEKLLSEIGYPFMLEDKTKEAQNV